MNQIQANKNHCKYCFQVLLSCLHNQKPSSIPSDIQDVEAPLFVTWNYKGELRGCIGTFQSEKLSVNLLKFAYTSAFQDSRFSPISLKEVENLDVAVSLLVNFEKNKKWNEWTVGKHGIIIEFEFDQQQYRGTYLPEVASEQKWDVETTVQSLIRKTGCYSKNYAEIFPKINLTTYESSKAKLSYKEFQDQ